MDAHFNEYLAAVAGMAEVYGTVADEHPAGELAGENDRPVAAQPVAAQC